LTAEDAIAEWRRTIVPAILRRQVTSADRVMAIAHCVLWATWRAQLDDAAKHEQLVALVRYEKPSPNHPRQLANRTLMLLTKIDSELGLTPVSRARVQVPPDTSSADESKWAGLLGSS